MRTRLKAAAVSLLGLALLGWFFRGTDFTAIRESVARAHPSFIILAVGLTMLTYVMRAVRWKYLLRPVGPAGLGALFVATVIGFTLNFLLLTGRLGEFARPYLLARREGLSASATLATIFLERVLDLATVVVLVGFWLLVGGALPGKESAQGVRALTAGVSVAAFASIAGLIVMTVFVSKREKGLSWLAILARRLPARVGSLVMKFSDSFTAGLNVLRDPAALGMAGLFSFLIWVNIALALWCGARAFDVALSVGDTFLVIGFLVVGVAVPTPGAVGGYHLMYELALTMLFNVETNVAKAAALLNHLIAFVPVSLLGILLLNWQKLSFGDIKQMVGRAERAEVK